MTVAFDTLKFARALRDKGALTQVQAEGIAEAFAEATSEQLPTKSDLRNLETKLETRIQAVETKIHDVETRLEAKIETTAATLKVDILRWLVLTQIALGGFVFAAFKMAR